MFEKEVHGGGGGGGGGGQRGSREEREYSTWKVTSVACLVSVAMTCQLTSCCVYWW